LGRLGLDRVVQEQLIQRLDGAMSSDAEQSQGQTHRLSAKRYTCADENLQEQQTLFSRYPVIIGHQSQLQDVGDYLTTELAGVPLVAIRSDIQTVSVFVKEDLNIAASIQSTLKSGLEESLILGSAEEGVRLFHAARDKAMATEEGLT
jgi:hypothetical protein